MKLLWSSEKSLKETILKRTYEIFFSYRNALKAFQYFFLKFKGKTSEDRLKVSEKQLNMCILPEKTYKAVPGLSYRRK
jgi:hypothetical protein